MWPRARRSLVGVEGKLRLQYTEEAMAITRIKVSNFKSFDELEVELRPLNIVVGSNAAGKSNFLEIFRFIHDLTVEGGFENAVSRQGGMEFLTNLQIGSSRPFSLEVTFDVNSDVLARTMLTERFDTFTYRIELTSSTGSPGFEVAEEDSLGLLLLEHVDIALFDFDPKVLKCSVPISGQARLEPDGSNLALVLRNILKSPKNRATFNRLLRDMVPFIEDLRAERFPDKSLVIAAKVYFGGRTLPASYLSDGTIQLTALILTLYFHDAAVTIVEEPERNIHPHLISKVARMMADASRQKQVIATTHNPELVKHAELADLLLVTRDAQGFSHVARPAESTELKIFLENDLGVDELYVQNLLGVGHGV